MNNYNQMSVDHSHKPHFHQRNFPPGIGTFGGIRFHRKDQTLTYVPGTLF